MPRVHRLATAATALLIRTAYSQCSVAKRNDQSLQCRCNPQKGQQTNSSALPAQNAQCPHLTLAVHFCLRSKRLVPRFPSVVPPFSARTGEPEKCAKFEFEKARQLERTFFTGVASVVSRSETPVVNCSWHFRFCSCHSGRLAMPENIFSWIREKSFAKKFQSF